MWEQCNLTDVLLLPNAAKLIVNTNKLKNFVVELS